MAVVAPSQSSGVDYDYLFKVILIGDANVGKSSLISQFCNDKFMDTVASTVGVDFYIKDFDINGKKVKVNSYICYVKSANVKHYEKDYARYLIAVEICDFSFISIQFVYFSLSCMSVCWRMWPNVRSMQDLLVKYPGPWLQNKICDSAI